MACSLATASCVRITLWPVAIKHLMPEICPEQFDLVSNSFYTSHVL